MSRFCFFVLISFLPQIIFAQSGYKEKDTSKYSKTEILTINADTKTKVYYKNAEICKIQRDFIGSTFSSTTIYYIKDGQLSHSVYASLRKPNTYYEEHLYFENGKLIKWVNSDKKKGVPGSNVFIVKEKLTFKFFEEELIEVRSRSKK